MKSWNILKKTKKANGRRHIYLFGVKVFSYKKKNKSSLNDKYVYKIPDNIDLVVGIPRSGMIPAYMIGFLRNLPVCSLNEFMAGNLKRDGERKIKEITEEKLNILVIDDSCSSGRAMCRARQAVGNLSEKHNIMYMAVYVLPGSEHYIDIYAEVVPNPRMFQWNYLNHPNIEQCCFDIDGVLCYDPTPEQNDDGQEYIRFLETARPKYIPKYKIGALVTSRLEKYRKHTEDWLKKNNISYNKLYMLNLPSKEERIRLNAHASFKSEVFAKKGLVFYESEPKQAEEIALKTGKPVVCTENNTLYYKKMIK
ncbi:MAG: phosphoribosyl transferase [Alphaproteobacteria bacterium]|nr:phosphoribosyl transferase [Alphaproteobacteria bacterium]